MEMCNTACHDDLMSCPTASTDLSLKLSIMMNISSETTRCDKKHTPSNALQVTPSNCAICTRFVSSFSKDEGLSLGPVSSLLLGSCSHVAFFKGVKMRDGQPLSDYEEAVFHVSRSPSDSVSFLLDCLPSSFGNWALLYRPEVYMHPGKALIVDPQWVDARVVKNWISTCDGTHGPRCKASTLSKGEEEIQPFYLIDTWEKCVVRSDRSMKEYVALSYVWGQTRTLRNYSKISPILQQKGVLATEKISRLLPPTIKDAIGITQLLGKRYLWVDALCVLQDDTQFLETELGKMHRIYACACFTIIAAVGTDASYGLRGFKGLTAPRRKRQEPIQLGVPERIIQANFPLRFPEARPVEELSTSYYQRGWTFQERLFSKRRLIFDKEGVKWECQCSEWQEDMIQNLEVESSFDDHERLFSETVPTLERLSQAIRQYNGRKFTFPEDAVPAFQGIQSILHRKYAGGVLYGHPELFFDITLSWMPIGDINRRIPRATTKHLPSWSWIGWQGSVRFPDDDEMNMQWPWRHVCEIVGFTMPVAKWYTSKSPSGFERRRINSTWHDYKLLAQEENADLPSGWHRKEEKTDFRRLGIYATLFKFRSVPKYIFHNNEHQRSVWYPLPDPNVSEASIQPQTSFVFAQTSRAYLYVKTPNLKHKEASMASTNSEVTSLHITDQSGNFVGHLQLHHTNELDEINSNNGKRLEMVATCKGYTGKIFDYELAERIKKETGAKGWAPQLKNCYFVLWIEWKNGVAYRRGAGAVTEKAWESERESELVDLVLG